jgi:hypothetical protein
MSLESNHCIIINRLAELGFRCDCHIIPQLFTGKDLTFPIEQDNSNVRHYLARFRRKTKVVSKCRTMVDLSLRLLHHRQDPATYASYAKTFCFIFG